jgi:hypothetical protein
MRAARCIIVACLASLPTASVGRARCSANTFEHTHSLLPVAETLDVSVPADPLRNTRGTIDWGDWDGRGLQEYIGAWVTAQ